MMTKKLLTKLLLVPFVLGFSTEMDAQFWKKKKPETTTKAKKTPPKKGNIQPYGKVVTKDYKTD